MSKATVGFKLRGELYSGYYMGGWGNRTLIIAWATCTVQG